ncbi:hypothetical protein BV25DRAFT_1835434 [Artomyces pyxidatus]|uniref:Uncharacterized protein n=1 Tax=Artomyces pyxidatus TaxID=48021 RepID=A0ACB8TF96_9AGAM|nr:hypothetical protein BV25DRAFT_1835434 [Artomyces pyxidatus]
MEPMLVYFILRKISDWSMSIFYSEVEVVGKENVPKDSPLLVCANHHNEIMDIATLTATIPHRRQVSFWAKSSMFKNPITRFILTSSGAIPVKRNPNAPKDSSSSSATIPANESLFAETSRALAGERPRGNLANYVTGVWPDRVVGVFPEGTSYTEPHIMQAKEGAAWAALDFAKWKAEDDKAGVKPLSVVPVGLVYTDKSQYQSRYSKIYVKYGEPIPIQAYARDYVAASLSNDSTTAHSIVAKLTENIRTELVKLSINAPTWDVLYSAEIARNILWDDQADQMKLEDFDKTTRTIIALLSDPDVKTDVEARRLTISSLLKYSGLLHYSGLRHNTLSAVLPATSSPGKCQAIRSLIFQFAVTLLHPRLILFFPVAILYTPAYLLGFLASRSLANPLLPETVAEFKVIVGGVGLGISYSAVTIALTRLALYLGRHGALTTGRRPVDFVVPSLELAGRFLRGEGGLSGRVWGIAGLAATVYLSLKFLTHWHKWLVRGNYTQLKRLIASYKLAAGLLRPASAALAADKLGPYLHGPPTPPLNPFVKYQPKDTNGSSTDDANKRILRAPPVASHKLIRHLLDARKDALRSVAQYVAGLSLKGDGVDDVKRRAAALNLRRYTDLQR